MEHFFAPCPRGLEAVLAQELAALGASVKVSVLCPGFVRTRIADSNRNRPATFAEGAERIRPEAFEQTIRAAIASGLPASEVATLVATAIREERFYVFPHPDITTARVRARLEDILAGRTPAPGPLPQLG